MCHSSPVLPPSPRRRLVDVFFENSPMIRFSWLRTCKGVLLSLTIGCVLLFCISTNYRTSQITGFAPIIVEGNATPSSSPSLSPSLRHHPFDNECKFPLMNVYGADISIWQYAERLRTLKCPVDHPLATMDSEGAIYVHPHFAYYPNKTEANICKILIMEGALRNKITNRGKDEVRTVAILDALYNTRFIVNADIFTIHCVDKMSNTTVWQKHFAGMYDSTKPKNTLLIVPDTPNFDQYGKRRKVKKKAAPERLSIDILGFDSTSRTMFQRHMPQTWETMHRLGFEVLYGYNKIGDNSMVNLAPILVGDVKEALEQPKLDSSGDINAQWILPTTLKMDPTILPFLWKMMKEKYGCKSMLNEDISQKSLGLFHYPPNEFLPGFTESPADHFYRAYYLQVYKNWTYSPCKDGSQIQKEFVDLWYRFANNYRDICHFGFTFVTTLTHENAFLIETLDEHVSQRLESLDANGVLDNSLSIIMGDHGNRIGVIQYSYSGRVEERMPLMAIRIPPKIRDSHPEQYRRFQENLYKLTSNFDVHQLLVDVAEMKFGEDRQQPKGRGISLFREIPQNRTCYDAYIPENFCACLVDRSAVKEPLPTKALPLPPAISNSSMIAIRRWLSEEKLDRCINITLPKAVEFSILGTNPLNRHGLRSKLNVTVVEAARYKNPPKMDFLFHEANLTATLKSDPPENVSLLFRVENDVARDLFTVNFEPSLFHQPPSCEYKSIFDVCECLGLF